jgi:general secretion pathway protein A
VDEAHELSDEVLEEIRLLMNFESDNAKHLQIILTGQPELREKLKQQNLRQLKQRVALRCIMPALPNVNEVERYITQRLSIAGSSQPNIFSPGAIDFIFQCSEGIPRQINNLCDNAMIASYAANEQIIGRAVIEEVADNLDLLPDKEALLASDKAVEAVSSARVLTSLGREELLNENKGATQDSAVEEIKAKPNSSNGRDEE